MKIKFFEKKTISIMLLLVVMVVGCLRLSAMHADVLPNTQTIATIFPDQNLALKVAKQLGKGVDTEVTQAELDQISTLNAGRSNVQNLEGIQYLRHVVDLNLEVNNISDITLLSDLNRLRTLNLYQNKISDIQSLSGLVNLQNVNISSNSVASFIPLNSIPNLLVLNISNNAGGVQLQQIAANTTLQSLSADGNGLVDLASLQTLVNLNILSLNNNQITDIAPLQSLQNMQFISLDSNQIADVSLFAGFSQLKQMTVANNKIQDVNAIRGLTLLNKVIISNNPITSLEPVRQLMNLTHLEFNVTGIQDISPVQNLTNMKQLSFNLGYNKVVDLSPVANLTNLTNLYFNGNAIQDISPLQNLTKIESLWMSSNQIQSLEAIGNIQKLKVIYFDQNLISDISILSRMNTSKLEWINGGSNYITDISPLASLQNPYTSIIYFKDQRATIPPQSTQRTGIEMQNITVDLDGTPIASYEMLGANAIASNNPLIVNGVPSTTTASLVFDGLAEGDYTAAYKVSKTQSYLYATMYYSVVVDQDISVLAPYRVRYHANGGSLNVPVDNRAYVRGEGTLVLGPNEMTHDSASFVEWNTKADGTGSVYSENDMLVNLQSDVDLYAFWKPDVIIIPEITKPLKPLPDKVLIFAESDDVDTGDAMDIPFLLNTLGLSFVAIMVMRKSIQSK